MRYRVIGPRACTTMAGPRDRRRTPTRVAAPSGATYGTYDALYGSTSRTTSTTETNCLTCNRTYMRAHTTCGGGKPPPLLPLLALESGELLDSLFFLKKEPVVS